MLTLAMTAWATPAQARELKPSNCGPGWEFDRRQKSGDDICNSSKACYYWHGGYVNGDFQGCGWIRDVDANSDSSQSHTGCAPGTINKDKCDYMYCPNGTPVIWGGSDDGTEVDLRIPCYMVANIRPWLNNQHLTGHIVARDSSGNPFTPQQDLRRFKLRYPARYTVDGYAYVMVHNTQPIAGEPNWAFMPWACF